MIPKECRQWHNRQTHRTMDRFSEEENISYLNFIHLYIADIGCWLIFDHFKTEIRGNFLLIGSSLVNWNGYVKTEEQQEEEKN